MQNIPFLTQQVVRDLAWAVYSSNLIDDFAFHPLGEWVRPCLIPLTEQRQRRLLQLDAKPDPLYRALECRKSTRLGIYFEALWQFFIDTDPELELLAANLPVYRQQQTLGAFDILYRDIENNKIVHLELATKYYLNTNTPDETCDDPIKLSNWLGPNAKDRLDIKLQRLLSHQIKLSDLPEAEYLLSQRRSPVSKRQIALKGTLFYRPPGLSDNPSDIFPLSPSHNHGLWLPYGEFINNCKKHDQWHILQRPQWISPAFIPGTVDSGNILDSATTTNLLSQHFANASALPVMLCKMQKIENNYLEATRYMITGENWPNFDD